MAKYVLTQNIDISASTKDGWSFVQLNPELGGKLGAAEKVFDRLMEDPKRAHHILGGDLWREFQAAFYK